mmetsp:Transcript_9237/g.14693  ORF Transcript_9237/g.14693 Transcript_9237/m.14693 type:complete len:126 (-) Transcript_9237:3-380(-)
MTDKNYRDFAALNLSEDKALVAFPCNQFGSQESGSPAGIKAFAQKYGLRVNEPSSGFWLMGKANVNGENTHPVWSFLKKYSGKGGNVNWNFDTKFLVRCSGETCSVDRYDNQKLASQIMEPRSDL